MTGRHCPICKREIPASEGRPSFGPFCSARCRAIDLGAWLEGRYSIPVTEDENEDETPSTRPADHESEDSRSKN